MMKQTMLLIVLLMPSVAPAANHYVLSSAKGSGDGSDWVNACTSFTGSCAVSSLVRGDTYYVGTGSYSVATFNRATSGTSLITILGATASDHGTSTGWDSSFGVDVTQATFSNGHIE